MAATTVMTTRAMPSYRGAGSDFYPLELDQPTKDFKTRTHWAHQANNSNNNSNMNQQRMPRTPMPDNQKQQPGGENGYPMQLNRPRKLSMATSATTVTVTPLDTPRDSIDSRSRSSSWSSQTSYQSTDSKPVYSAWRPEYAHSRPSPVRTAFRPVRRPTGELFAALPGEVLDLILSKLKDQHSDRRNDSCATCWMRDLCTIASTSKKWYYFARKALYENIQLDGDDLTTQKKRYKIAFGSRLVLLRRTLRANPSLASHVRTLKVPSLPSGANEEDYHNLVATLIMECPNFERLIGLHPRYDHTFNRLFHALSTRQQLKHMDWIVEPQGQQPLQQQQQQQRPLMRPGSSSGKGSGTLTKSRWNAVSPPEGPQQLGPQESMAFLDMHVNWTSLTTISIHCLPRGTMSSEGLVTRALRRLPALQHLFLSRLSHIAFNDQSLTSLPPLETLSLSHLPGVTSAGLSALATLPASQGITKLTLRHVNLDSLPALVRIFSNLTHLETFSFVQNYAPHLPEDTMIWLMPYLASSSLRKLHWDITSPAPMASSADDILARSISAGGFPCLRILRAPNDPEAVFQSLCRPRERTEIVTDRFMRLGRHNFSISSQGSSGSDRTPGSPKPPMSPTTPMTPMTPTSPLKNILRDASDLREARIAAQARLEDARHHPRFLVRVIDEDRTVVEEFGLAGFLGTVGSPIRYWLLSDAGARDDKGGLTDMADVMGDCGESIEENEGCIGRWNMTTSGHVDRKEKERWWHTERGRWKGIEMS